MQAVPRKNKTRKISNKKAGLIALIVIAALTACAVYALTRLRGQPEWPEAQSAAPRHLVSTAREEIASVTVRPKEGEIYSLLSRETGIVLLGQEDTALRADIAEDYFNRAVYIEGETVYDSLAECGLPEKDFGLDEPRLRLIIGYTDGSERELRVGSAVPGENEDIVYYCAVSGDSALYTVTGGQIDLYFHDVYYLTDFRQPQLDASLLDRITVTGAVNLDISYTENGWLMEVPCAYPVSRTRSDSLLQKIGNMAFEAFLGSADTLDLAAYGLNEPCLTVRLLQAPTVLTGETTQGEQVSFDLPALEYTLLIGNDTGRSGVYLIYDGNVYRASNFLLGFWKELDPLSFAERNPVSFQIYELKRLTLDLPGNSCSFEIEMVEAVTDNNEIATDESGNILYDAQILHRQTVIDTQAFLTQYVRLSEIAMTGRLERDYRPDGLPAASLTLETAAQTRKIDFYPYDPLHTAVSVNGTALFYTDIRILDELNATALLVSPQ